MISAKNKNTEELKKESMYEDLVASKEKIIKLQNEQIAMYEKMISMKDIFSETSSFKKLFIFSKWNFSIRYLSSCPLTGK